MAVRRALSCLLAAGLVIPALSVAAVPAAADPLVSGITVDTGYGDGLFMSAPSSRLSPTYEATATVNVAVTTFKTRAVSSGTYSGPTVAIAPPTSATTLAPGHYTTADTATDTVAGLVVKSSTACGTTAEGTLDVVDVAYASGAISSLTAHWSYRCTGAAAWAFGEVRYASATGVTSGSETRFVQLGSTGVGTTTAAKASTLRNNGTLPLTFGTAHFTGADPGDFAVSADTCSGQTLAVGATCTVSVTSSPTAAGDRAAELEVPDGSARGFRHTDVFSGGLTPPTAPTSVAATTATDGVAVTWGLPADNGGSSITGFQVFRGTSPDSLTFLGTASGLRYGDTLSGTTASSTSYVYAVTAANAVGASPQSSTATATTPASAAVPSATALLSADVASGYSTAVPDGTTVRRDQEAGDTVTASATIQSTLGLSGARSGSSTLTATFTPPAGTPLGVGTFPLAATADASHGSLSAFGLGSLGYCPPGTGSVSITRLDETAAGAVAFLDADLSFACGSASMVNHLSARFGTATTYSEVTVADVDAGDAVVSGSKTVQSSYTNTGTTTVTVSGVALTASDGTATSDWMFPAGGATCAGAVLSPGASCTTDIASTPTTGGTRTGLVVYSDSTPAGTHTRHLTAYGALTPLAPSSFSVSRQAGKVSLSWSNGFSDGAGRMPSSWTVLVGPDTDHLSPLSTATSPTVTDPSTADGYRVYRVTATNAAGTSPSTDVPVDAGLDAPTAAGFTTVKTLSLSWQAGSKLPSDPATGYRVYRGTTATTLTAVADVTTLSYTSAAPAAGVHAYLVVAPLAGATVGPRSAVVDLVGTTTQLVVSTLTASASRLDIRGTNGGTGSTLPLTNPGYPQARLDVAVNPQGTKVAYVQESSTNHVSDDIWVSNVDGSGSPLQITSSGAQKDGLGWSLDGTKVAYAEASGSSSVLKVVSTDGSNVTSTVPGSTGLSHPSYLDAATLVAEDDSSLTAPLVKVDVANGTRTALSATAGGISPSVRPDGTEIAYLLPTGANHYDLLRVVNLRTNAVRVIPAPTSSYLSTPSWTRDGSRLYTATDRGSVISVASDGASAFSSSGSTGAVGVAVSTPDTTAPTGLKLAGVPTSTLAASLTPTFSASDALNGIRSYTLLYRRAAYNSGFGATVSLTLTAPRAITLIKGSTYCFSLRATDRAGNTTPTSAEQCTVVPLDDRSLTRSSAFAPITSSAYYAATAMRTTSKGATLTRTGLMAQSQLLVVVTTCSTCGTFDVFLGSTRIGSVNLHSATTVNKKVIALPSFSIRNGTVTLRVTSSGKTVIIDGLGVRK
jgi:hypothetical protein